jgi:hypothetical protein
VSIAIWISVAAMCCGWSVFVAREIRHLTQTPKGEQ